MSYRCILVDDEPLGRKILSDYLEKIPEWTLVREFSDCLTLENYLLSNKVDLLLLDIQMPLISGIEFLGSSKNAPLTTFTTAYPNYAVDAFELAAFDYLVKPISFERFRRSLSRASGILAGQNDPATWISIKEGKRIYKVGTYEIHWLQAYGDYVRIYTTDKTYLAKSKLSEFAKDLPSSIIQCHRSWYVNLDHVEYFEGAHVKIQDKLIPVSGSYKNKILDYLN